MSPHLSFACCANLLPLSAKFFAKSSCPFAMRSEIKNRRIQTKEWIKSTQVKHGNVNRQLHHFAQGIGSFLVSSERFLDPLLLQQLQLAEFPFNLLSEILDARRASPALSQVDVHDPVPLLTLVACCVIERVTL